MNPLASGGFDIYTGYGRVNFGKAVVLARDWRATAEPVAAISSSSAKERPLQLGRYRGEYETAVDYYERVLAVDGNLADGYWGLATSQYELKRNEQALRHYQRFLELAPKSNLADRARDRIAELREQVDRKP